MSALWKSVNKSELVAAGLLIALGVAIVRQALGWVYLTPDGPGPGFFPFWTGSAIIVLASGVALRVIHHGYRRGGSGVDWSRARPALLGWCGLAVSIALLEPAGFVASFLLLTLFLVKVIYGRSFATALAVGAGASAAFWVLFAKLLQVQLPAGPWGF